MRDGQISAPDKERIYAVYIRNFTVVDHAVGVFNLADQGDFTSRHGQMLFQAAASIVGRP